MYLITEFLSLFVALKFSTT